MSPEGPRCDQAADSVGVGQPTGGPAYTAAVSIAVLAFDFDPLLRLADGIVVRWQTLALAGTILLALMLAVAGARRSGMRPDDLLYLAIGAVPGAVLGGRLGDLVLRPETYLGRPTAIVDPAVGGLELALGVVGGTASAVYVAILLGAPVGRWSRTVVPPVLLALGLGKLTMALGGAGQGLPLDAAWATAYLGPGPWASAAPDLPSHPAQLYEGAATLLLAAATAVLVPSGRTAGRDVRWLLVALGLWALLRAAVTPTWRDPAIVGPFPAAGVLALVVAAGMLVLAAAVIAWSARRVRAAVRAGDPSWPDPETRPRF